MSDKKTNDFQELAQEEDLFWRDLADLKIILAKNNIGNLAWELAKDCPELAEILSYELNVSIRQTRRSFR